MAAIKGEARGEQEGKGHRIPCEIWGSFNRIRCRTGLFRWNRGEPEPELSLAAITGEIPSPEAELR